MTASANLVTVDEDVHGISHRDGSLLAIGIDNQSLPIPSFSEVTWYITASGTVRYLVDGTEIDTFTVNGLAVFSVTYDVGTTVMVSFVTDDNVYSFRLNIRAVLTAGDVGDMTDSTVRMSPSEVRTLELRNIGIGAIAVISSVIVAVFLARRSVDNGEDAL